MFHRKQHQTSDSRELPIISSKKSKAKSRSNGNEERMAFLRQKQEHPTNFRTFSNAALYVLSGCSQPLIVTLLKEAGIADSKCQFYMLFYYIMPSLFTLPLILMDRHSNWPTRSAVLKACGIAAWDITSTTMNYTGAAMAGPTIFAIVYSSVTIWTAIFSQLLLGRRMNLWQWINVVMVFAGLTITATDSVNTGDNVLKGTFLVILGSGMHGLTYVMSEAVMTVGEEKLTVLQNNFVQTSVAASLFLTWQVVYTFPHFEELIQNPAQAAGTTFWYALIILSGFGISNVIHSMTFFHTLRHFPGGATSAGVMKGMQAVLVFVFTNLLYCGRMGGSEMCFSTAKLLSLITVCGGVLGYGYATKLSQAKASLMPATKKSENQNETTLLI